MHTWGRRQILSYFLFIYFFCTVDKQWRPVANDKTFSTVVITYWCRAIPCSSPDHWPYGSNISFSEDTLAGIWMFMTYLFRESHSRWYFITYTRADYDDVLSHGQLLVSHLPLSFLTILGYLTVCKHTNGIHHFVSEKKKKKEKKVSRKNKIPLVPGI